MFIDLLNKIWEVSYINFEIASAELENYVNKETDFINILKQIGTIPEAIVHDSTEEKLFSKASDAVLARAFREIGLKSTVMRGRGDSADVLAKSPTHGYTLVADAKAFRMSRTAKNQKDFKVVALSGWRRDADYAVLCSPYFQYPFTKSQIYEQAIQNNVCLLSWEHLAFLIENNIKESTELNFSSLWKFCKEYAKVIRCSEMKRSFMKSFDEAMARLLMINEELFIKLLSEQIEIIKARGSDEKTFLEEEIKKIESYSKEEAIRELIQSKKINEKLFQIDTYIKGLRI